MKLKRRISKKADYWYSLLCTQVLIAKVLNKIFVFSKISDFFRKATYLLFHRILWSCVKTRPINLKIWYNVHVVMMYNISNFQRSSIDHEWERIISSLPAKTVGAPCTIKSQLSTMVPVQEKNVINLFYAASRGGT